MEAELDLFLGGRVILPDAPFLSWSSPFSDPDLMARFRLERLRPTTWILYLFSAYWREGAMSKRMLQEAVWFGGRPS